MSQIDVRPSQEKRSLLHAKPWQLIMIGLGTAATQLDTAVNIALPAITHGLDLSISDIQWVIIFYALTYTSLLLAFGRIGDAVGHLTVFRIGLAWTALSLLLVGWSPNYGSMLVFRCMQGIGTALVLSCGAALVISLYGEQHRGRALGIYTMMLSLGLMLGPLFGGALVELWDWPAVFWFRSPLALLALLLLRGIPALPSRQVSGRFDVVGNIILMLGLVAMLLALNRIRELSAIWLGLLSVVAFSAFVFRESRSAHPLIAAKTALQPGFLLLNLASVLINLAAFSVWLLVPYFLVRSTGYSLLLSGAILATAAAGTVVAAPIGGRLVGRRISAHWLAVVGAAATATGLLGLGVWSEQTATLLRITALVLQGVGLGLFQLAYSDIVTATLPANDRGVAGSLILLTRTFGMVTAASVVLMVFETLEARSGFVEGFRETFQIAASLAFAVAIWLAIPRRKKRGI